MTIVKIFGLLFTSLLTRYIYATPSNKKDVLIRRGILPYYSYDNNEKNLSTDNSIKGIKLEFPANGWTSSRSTTIAGFCEETTADPVNISINGVTYYARLVKNAFKKTFPLAPAQNNIEVICAGKKGVFKLKKTIYASIPPVGLKLVLSSDTDDVWTDLHIYEPDGKHIYWANSASGSGGLFFLNNDGEEFDRPGYGPYIYTHFSPPLGVFRIDVNYYPGGAVRHTVANLDVIIDEGLATEKKIKIKKALSVPGSIETLAFITIRPNKQTPLIYIPGVSVDKEKPEIDPKKLNKDNNDYENNN